MPRSLSRDEAAVMHSGGSTATIVRRRPSLLFILLVLSGTSFTICGVRAQLPSGVCDIPVCRSCASKCPDFRLQADDYVDCTKKLAFARSKYVSSAMLDCKVEPCAEYLLNDACGFIQESPIPSQRAELHAALQKVMENANAEADEFDAKATKLAQAPSGERKAYYDKVVRKLIEIQLFFMNALRTRADYFIQQDYMSSLKYRREQHEVKRIRLENDELRSRLQFWRARNASLNAAVHTSTLGLRAARDALSAEYAAYAGDAALMAALRNASLSKEQRAVVLINLTERTRLQLSQVRTVMAKIRAEREFIREAQQEIFHMLTDIFQRIHFRQIRVPCGILALSDMVTDTLMESMSKTE